MNRILEKYKFDKEKLKSCLKKTSKIYHLDMETTIEYVSTNDVYIGSKKKGVNNPVIEGVKNIDATSGSMNKIDGESATQFSPMYLGPVIEKDIFGKGEKTALIFENYWQYGKVFPELGHVGENGKITKKWLEFREKGYKKAKGDRHPVGTKTDRVKFVDRRGRKWYEYMIPSFARYYGEKMDYITSRKKVYVPAYAYLVRRTEAFKKLKEKVDNGFKVQILDFDGPKDGSALITVDYLRKKINDPSSPFGHGFVISALLAGIEPEEYID